MLDVLSAGNANIDLIINSDKLPKQASPVIMPGGSAANYAVGCARLGLKTGFTGFVGNDFFGRQLLKNFTKQKVKAYIKKVNNHTGIVTVFTSKRFKRMYPVRGANNQLSSLDLKQLSTQAKHLHLATPAKELLSQLRYFKSTSLDPGSTISKLSFKELEKYFKKITLFFPNKKEIKAICGEPYIKSAEMICNAGCKVVVVKLGPKGCYVRSGNQSFRVPSIDYPVIDTTGAGDAFNSAFTYGYLAGKPLERCALMGVVSSNLCITKLGAQNSPTIKELNSILKKVYNK